MAQLVKRNLLHIEIPVVEEQAVIYNDKRKKNQKGHHQPQNESADILIIPEPAGGAVWQMLHSGILLFPERQTFFNIPLYHKKKRSGREKWFYRAKPSDGEKIAGCRAK